jgi:ABC-type lipoprotein export system ATPase subunit
LDPLTNFAFKFNLRRYTTVVGPPGTGKTDTATQILHCLYHNEPGQRTLLITHSNAALNDLFQKLMQRDVPARYLLRLGQAGAYTRPLLNST